MGLAYLYIACGCFYAYESGSKGVQRDQPFLQEVLILLASTDMAQSEFFTLLTKRVGRFLSAAVGCMISFGVHEG